jgi:predicted RNase H-like nuclease (RuvC/YqgF family)
MKLRLSVQITNARRAAAVGLCLFVAGCQEGYNRTDTNAQADTARNASIANLERRVTSLEKQLGEETSGRERLKDRGNANSSGMQNFQPAVPGNRHYLVQGDNRSLYTDKERCEAARATLLRAYSDAGDGQVERTKAQPELRCVAA